MAATKCIVCTEEYSSSTAQLMCRQLPCSHRLCHGCLSQMLQGSTSLRRCPSCRSDLTGFKAEDYKRDVETEATAEMLRAARQRASTPASSGGLSLSHSTMSSLVTDLFSQVAALTSKLNRAEGDNLLVTSRLAEQNDRISALIGRVAAAEQREAANRPAIAWAQKQWELQEEARLKAAREAETARLKALQEAEEGRRFKEAAREAEAARRAQAQEEAIRKRKAEKEREEFEARERAEKDEQRKRSMRSTGAICHAARNYLRGYDYQLIHELRDALTRSGNWPPVSSSGFGSSNRDLRHLLVNHRRGPDDIWLWRELQGGDEFCSVTHTPDELGMYDAEMH